MAAKRSSKKSGQAPSPASRGEPIPIGKSEINPSDLKGLRRAWADGSLVFFLGAGVSIPYGLPSWRELVLELLFKQAENTHGLGSLMPNYRRALAEWMTDYFDYNPLVLARMVEKDLERKAREDGRPSFIETLQEKLYESQRVPPATERTTLRAIADLIEASDQRANTGVRKVITFNFDDLLETELIRRNVGHLVIQNGSRNTGAGFRVVHPHGYVPRPAAHPASGDPPPLARRNLVFNETDYHHLTESIFHWGLSEIVSELRNSTVLFIGLSMSDPSLRRLLDAARNSKIPSHWQIQKRHSVPDNDLDRVKADVTARASRYAAHMDMSFQKGHRSLDAAIKGALKQADTYDREVYEHMGVKTIWIEDWADIVGVLDAIPAST